MHVKYVSSGAPTQAQVINDLAKLLSGSAIATLSASCDKANTTMISTVAPGWTLVSPTAPQSGAVVGTMDLAQLTTKFVRIFAPGTTTIDVMGYEGWNSTTNIGINATTGNTSTNQLPFLTNTVNTYWIFSTARSFYIQSNNGTGLGSMEFSRDCQYLKGSTYPCFAMVNAINLGAVRSNPVLGLPLITDSMTIPRIKNFISTGDSSPVNASVGTIAPRFVSLFNDFANTVNINFTSTVGSPNTAIQDSQGTYYHEMRPMWALKSIVTDQIGNPRQVILGKFFDVVEITQNAGGTFDTFVSDGITYMLVNTPGGTFAFKVA